VRALQHRIRSSRSRAAGSVPSGAGIIPRRHVRSRSIVSRWARFLSTATSAPTGIVSTIAGGPSDVRTWKDSFLKGTPLFSDCRRGPRHRSPGGRGSDGLPGDFVFTSGVRSDHFYVVISGWCPSRIAARTPSGGPSGNIGEFAVSGPGTLSNSARPCR